MKDFHFNLLKTSYLLRNFADYILVPRWFYRMCRDGILQRLTVCEKQEIERRVAYYCRLNTASVISGGQSVGDYRFPFKEKRRFTTYFFDLYNVIKYFGKYNRFHFIPGDVTQIPALPTFVKSRPIDGDTTNAVLLKLNKLRHFTLIHHDKPFAEKRNMLVGRTAWANGSPLRVRLYEMFWNHPLCDVGKTHVDKNDSYPHTVKSYLSRREQLNYKFIACIEGVDVATNLKWVMSSNSIAVSPPMHYETWFMEGTLIPNYHYIEVKPDYSDLIEKLEYYIEHPVDAQAIIAHAHEYVSQFCNKRLELATQIVVADKYFKMTN